MEQNIRLIEEAYVSTGNSGIGIKVHEHQSSSGLNYTLTIHHGAFGHHSEFSTPIINLDHVRAMAEILTRTMVLMSQKSQDLDKYDSSRRVYNEVQQGLRFHPIYEEYIENEWGTNAYHVGNRVTDANTGEFIREDLFEFFRENGGSSCSGGGTPMYSKDDIGRMLTQDGGIHPTKRLDQARVLKDVVKFQTGELVKTGKGIKEGDTLVNKIVRNDTKAKAKTRK